MYILRPVSSGELSGPNAFLFYLGTSFLSHRRIGISFACRNSCLLWIDQIHENSVSLSCLIHTIDNHFSFLSLGSTGKKQYFSECRPYSMLSNLIFQNGKLRVSEKSIIYRRNNRFAFVYPKRICALLYHLFSAYHQNRAAISEIGNKDRSDIRPRLYLYIFTFCNRIPG